MTHTLRMTILGADGKNLPIHKLDAILGSEQTP
jgi:hypothetical protein